VRGNNGVGLDAVELKPFATYIKFNVFAHGIKKNRLLLVVVEAVPGRHGDTRKQTVKSIVLIFGPTTSLILRQPPQFTVTVADAGGGVKG
jgi:hypothetical protein